MPKYVLIMSGSMPSAEADSLESRIKEIGAEYYKVGSESWALQSTKSSREISERLFPRDDTKTPPTAGHVVLRCDAYWGFHDRALWELLDKRETGV